MNLHLDKNSFKVLLEQIHDKTGYREDILEKDYYVVLMLNELSKFQTKGLPAYFKGGTALYKMLKTTNRFSEDIDISVDTRNCSSRTQKDKILEQATKKYKSLHRDSSLGITNKSEIIQIYKYNSLVSFDKDDLLQRFERVKIEATSFTISEPVEDLTIEPIIYTLATEKQKEILKNKFEISPFIIKTMTMERIFIDKLFASEAYTRISGKEQKAFEAAKHIYDVVIMFKENRIISFIKNSKHMKKLLDIRMAEELNRLDGIPNIRPKDFKFFNNIKDNNEILKAYELMQKQYIFKEEYKINFETAVKTLLEIKKLLFKNSSWKNTD